MVIEEEAYELEAVTNRSPHVLVDLTRDSFYTSAASQSSIGRDCQ